MTSHVGRLYAVALALVVFFLVWAVVAARPWAAATADPRLKALAVREAQLRHEARLVNRIVARRWAVYRAHLRARNREIAAARAAQARAQAQATQAQAVQLAGAPVSAAAASASPAVRVVTLPPLTITRTS